MEDKRTRILETAIELAEQGGFEGVRLRDVAAHADVALGTLYKRFRSKEDLLIAALELEAEKLERRVTARPPQGDTQIERVLSFFEIATRSLFRRPNLARAVLRALTSGDVLLTTRVASFHELTTNMIVAALRGPTRDGGEDQTPRASEQMVAFILQQVWFASLVGWMGGLQTKAMVIENLRIALTIMLRGIDTEKEAL